MTLDMVRRARGSGARMRDLSQRETSLPDGQKLHMVPYRIYFRPNQS
ncbi:hypothetical protein OKW33_002242 [Paraburkholderia atlantica]